MYKKLLIIFTFCTSILSCGDDYEDDNNYNNYNYNPNNRINNSDGKEESPCSVTNDYCIGDNICIRGICSNAYTRSYDLTIETLRTNERNIYGEAWDAFGGLPDPQVSIYINGSQSAQCATPGKIDTTAASFYTTCQFRFLAGDQMEIYVYDEDNIQNDIMFICTATITTNTLRSGRLFCDTEEGYLTISIEPRG